MKKSILALHTEARSIIPQSSRHSTAVGQGASTRRRKDKTQRLSRERNPKAAREQQVRGTSASTKAALQSYYPQGKVPLTVVRGGNPRSLLVWKSRIRLECERHGMTTTHQTLPNRKTLQLRGRSKNTRGRPHISKLNVPR